MVLLQRLSHSLQFHSKLESHHHNNHHDHHHHQPEAALAASLDAFRSNTSSAFNQFLSSSKPPESQTLSLSWIHHCFKLFPIIYKAFTNLLAEIEHPFTKWDDTCIEEYLNYTIHLLDLLNAISSSLTNLAHSRLSLSHALALFTDHSPSSPNARFKPIELSKSLNKDQYLVGNTSKNGDKSSVVDTQDLIVHHALMILKSVSFSACGIFLSSISNNHDQQITYPCTTESYLTDMNSSACIEIAKKRGAVKEIKDVNAAVETLSESILSTEKTGETSEDLGIKLEGLEKMLECVGQDVDHLFREVLTRRDELLDCVRQKPM